MVNGVAIMEVAVARGPGSRRSGSVTTSLGTTQLRGTRTRRLVAFTEKSAAITSHRFRSFDEIDHRFDRDRPVVTMFSGGLDSSYLLLRLRQMDFTDVHALSVDIGELETQEKKQRIAVGLGATLHVSRA
jgi:asparagine synthetase B (glutamine-hydrolysing)